MTVLAVFRSRSRAVRFYESCRRNGVPANLLSTPRGITPYCSVSVRINRSDYTEGKRLLDALGKDSFVGWF